MAGIPLSSGFNVSAGIPLDLRTTVATIVDRDNIPTIGRYKGLLVFVESDSKYYYLKTGITNSDWVELSGFTSHTHTKADITDFSHTHTKSDITDFAHTHTKSDITDFSHTHSISDVSGLQTALDNKVNTSDVVTTATANKILKLDANAKLPASITGDADTVDGYHATSFALSSHTHTKSQITDFAHTHTKSEITDFAHTHSKSDITDFAHTHVISDITNLQTSLDAKVSKSGDIMDGNYTIRSTNSTTAILSVGKSSDSSQGTGAVEVTQDGSYGGGMSYNGDGNPTFVTGEGMDRITFYRMNGGTRSEVFSYTYNSDVVKFAATPTVGSTPLALNNQTMYIGTTAVAINRSSGALSLTGVSIDGNAGTATSLQTSRSINGTSFNGTADITTSNWGTSRTITIGNTGKSVNGSANVSWSLTEIGAASASHTHTYTEVNHSVTPPADGSISDSTLFNKGISIGGVFGNNTTYPVGYGTLVTFKEHDTRTFQLYVPVGLSWNPNIYIRTLYDQETHQWVKIWNELNDGSGSGLDADLLDGYHSSSFALASHTHTNYTPFASNSQTIPMNTPSGAWYRIAASGAYVGRCDGLFELEFAGSGCHQRVSFRASSMFNSDNSIQIAKMGGSKFENDNTFVIQSVRVVYYPNTYSSQYAYVEVFVTNPNTTINAVLYVRMVDAIGWDLTTGAGSIPTNYAAKELSVKNYNPFYNTNDKRNVITPSSGVLNIDLRLARNETVVSNITQNTTINISGLYDGAAGTIMLYLNGTYTITLGTMTNDAGSSVTKHTSGTFSSLAAGYYIIAYRVLPDASGTWRVFISISPKYS